MADLNIDKSPPIAGWQMLRDLAHALKIPFPVRRIVIEVDVNAVPVVYIQKYASENDSAAVASLLAAGCEPKVVEDVSVDEKGEVAAKVVAGFRSVEHAKDRIGRFVPHAEAKGPNVAGLKAASVAFAPEIAESNGTAAALEASWGDVADLTAITSTIGGSLRDIAGDLANPHSDLPHGEESWRDREQML